MAQDWPNIIPNIDTGESLPPISEEWLVRVMAQREIPANLRTELIIELRMCVISACNDQKDTKQQRTRVQLVMELRAMAYLEGSPEDKIGRTVILAGAVVALALCVLIPMILVR